MENKLNKNNDRIAKIEIDISKCHNIRLIRLLCSWSEHDKGVNYSGPSLETLEKIVGELDYVHEIEFQAFVKKWRIDHPAPVTKNESTLLSPILNILNLANQLGEKH